MIIEFKFHLKRIAYQPQANKGASPWVLKPPILAGSPKKMGPFMENKFSSKE